MLTQSQVTEISTAMKQAAAWVVRQSDSPLTAQGKAFYITQAMKRYSIPHGVGRCRKLNAVLDRRYAR